MGLRQFALQIRALCKDGCALPQHPTSNSVILDMTFEYEKDNHTDYIPFLKNACFNDGCVGVCGTMTVTHMAINRIIIGVGYIFTQLNSLCLGVRHFLKQNLNHKQLHRANRRRVHFC